jgi:hypothetical protein
MKAKLSFAVLAILSLGMTGTALATHWETVTPTADCEGWAVDATVTFGSVSQSVDVDYTIMLMQGSTVIETASGTDIVYREDPTLHIEGMWTTELCGDYTVEGTLTLTTYSGATDTVNFATDPFTCECPGDDNWDMINAEADCEGWSVYACIVFGSGATMADVSYTFTLMQDSDVIATVTDQVTIYDSDPCLDVSGSWNMELCGDYTLHGELNLETAHNTDTATFEEPFTCECPPPACHFTPGYWKNHEDAWPVMSLVLGNTTYNQAQLLEILREPVRGDMTVILAHHLIAAKLNVLNGGGDWIQDVIDDADDYLVMHPLHSRPTGAAKQEGEDIKDELADYNEMGCPDGMGDDKSLDSAGQPESTSWGSVKSQYR